MARHCSVNRSFIDCDVVRRVDGRQRGETRGCEVERAFRNVSRKLGTTLTYFHSKFVQQKPQEISILLFTEEDSSKFRIF